MEQKMTPQDIYNQATKYYAGMVNYEKTLFALYLEENKAYDKSQEFVLGQFDCYFQASLLLLAISDNKLKAEEVNFIKGITKFADVFRDRDLADFTNCDEIGITKITRACKKELKVIPEMIMMAVALDVDNDELPNYISTIFGYICQISYRLMGMDGDIQEIEFDKFTSIMDNAIKYCDSKSVKVLSIDDAKRQKEALLDARVIDKVKLSELTGIASSEFSEMKKEVEKALIYIEIECEEGRGSGSGFIISPNGYAITCAHVVNGAKKIFARVRPFGSKGMSFYCPANVVEMLETEDMALIKLDARGLPYLKLLPEDNMAEAGDEIALFGYPLGEEVADSRFLLNHSITKGTVASVQVKNGLETTLIDLLAVQGNSGGPIIMAKTGEVVGILLGAFVRGASPLVYMRPIKYVWQRFTK